VKEYPVFIPDGEEHLAAVVAVPDGSPRALVLLVTGGGGAPRSHRSSMFTKVARALCERGIASVRLDAKGIGDSTGLARFDLTAPPIESTVRALRFAMQATGATSVAMAGNCGGARTSMEVIQQVPEMRSAVLMFVKPLAVARSSKPSVLKIKGAVRSVPGLGRVAKRVYWLARSRRASPVVRQLRMLIGRVDLLLMEADTDKAGKLLKGGYGLKGDGTKRFEIRELPGGAQRAFRSPERQQYTIETLVRWFDETLPAGVAADAPARDARVGPPPR
jgi:alpha/beta superfamily hydrolase